MPMPGKPTALVHGVSPCATLEEIYARPENTFVARFIGDPPMNLIRCRPAGRSVRFPGDVTLQLPEGCASSHGPEREGTLGVRAEEFSVAPSDAVATGTLPADIVLSEYLGAETVVEFKRGQRADQAEQSTVAEHDVLQARIPGDVHPTPGAKCRALLDLTNASFSDVGSREPLTVAVREAST